MAKVSRRDLIKQAITLAGATTVSPVLVRAGTEPQYETRSTAHAPYVPVRVLDTEHMPGGDRKVLFENKQTKGSFFITYSFPPGPTGGFRHYHQWHEWGYLLCGDSALDEYTDADQRIAPLIDYREGHFLDRPPYCIHAATRTRFYHNVASSWVFMEEGSNEGSFTPDPSVPPGYFAKYNPEHKQGRQWAAPQTIDTIAMIWEPEASAPGAMVKRLVNDPSRGFRVVLRMVEPGWNSARSPQFTRPYHYKQGYQFNLVLSGDLKIQTYRAPGEKAEQIKLEKYYYVERAPMSIFGLADGVVSERGCIWIEGTYGKGATISSTPIEEPTFV